MQQRRGLKQDLPKPLRPGEIGFATDSRQLYIGADTESELAQQYNKTGVFEQTSSAQSTTFGLANVQMIKFTVPHKIYDKGEFDGVTTTTVWTPDDLVASSATATEYARLGDVFRTGDLYFRNIIDGNLFSPEQITVIKNGTELVASNVATISSSQDFFFAQGGDISSSTHTLTLRTPPSGAEEIAISYYGNTEVNHALSNTTVGITGVAGFNAYAGLTNNTFRQIDPDNVRVASGTGVGYIGMQFKHIQVATDVKTAPVAFDNSVALTLGNLLLTRIDEKVTDAVATANATTVSIVGAIAADTYNISGAYNHVYIDDAVTGDWLDGQVLEVTSYDSANTTIVTALPAISTSLVKSVTSYSIDGSNLNVVVSSTEDIEIGDDLYFIESPDDSNLNSKSGTVSAVDTGVSQTITVSALGTDANANVDTANLSFVTYKGGSSTEVVLTALNHGLSDGANAITTTNATVSSGTVNATTTGNVNTFILTTVGAITGEDLALTFTPVVSSGNVSITRTFAADLTSANTAEAAISAVSSYDEWPKLSTIPGSTESAYKVYVTHGEANAKTPFDFMMHNDRIDTLTTLGLEANTYSRSDSTVKADLENWINTLVSSTAVNLFKEVYVNTEFNSTGHFTTWDLKVNSEVKEMDFESREEARDFSAILNNLYFEAVNPDIKGLLNIKSNIEFLTLEGLGAATTVTSYDAPEAVTLTAGLNVIPELSISDLTLYDTYIIDYSLADTLSSNANVYRRIGTVSFTASAEAEQVTLMDTYTDLQANVTGNVEFTANVSGTALTFSANTTISPTTDIAMKYTVRRWLAE